MSENGLRSYKSATKEWKAAAMEAVFLTAQANQYLTIPDVWLHFPSGYTREDEITLGRVLRDAEKESWIERLETARKPDGRSIPVNVTVHPFEADRLAAQSTRILARLQQGITDTRELADIALKYSSRVSELRKVGYVIKVIETDYETGLRLYRLFSVPYWRSLVFGESL
jgi:hypothetical protein